MQPWRTNILFSAEGASIQVVDSGLPILRSDAIELVGCASAGVSLSHEPPAMRKFDLVSLLRTEDMRQAALSSILLYPGNEQ